MLIFTLPEPVDSACWHQNGLDSYTGNHHIVPLSTAPRQAPDHTVHSWAWGLDLSASYFSLNTEPWENSISK